MRIEFEGTVDEFRALFIEQGVDEVFAPSSVEEQEEVRQRFTTPLAVVPDGGEPTGGWAEPGEAITAPTNDAALSAAKMELPSLSPEQRDAAWSHFKSFCADWVRGFGDAEAEQPDRLAMMQELGQGQWPVPVLVMAYEIGSLQRLIEKGLVDAGEVVIPRPFLRGPGNDSAREEHLAHIDLIAANMVQVSHMGFPDLAGTYDYSTKWKRS